MTIRLSCLPSLPLPSRSSLHLFWHGFVSSASPKMASHPKMVPQETVNNKRIDLSLDRIRTLLQRLGAPQDKFPIVHIAGTNGKGSTSAYIDSLLQHTIGIRTGRFNSPHLREERDCCRVNGQVITKGVWAQAGEQVAAADAGLTEGLTEEQLSLHSTPFELLVARAFVSYALLPQAEAPAVLIVEVGLGGRLDATNVFSPRNVLASVICPVDRDHEALLGSDLAGIASHKAGIIPGGGLCVIADQRRADDPQSINTEVDLACLRAAQGEQTPTGSHAATILNAIRQAAIERGARLVKGYVPWGALSPTQLNSSSSGPIRQPTAALRIRYAPTLFPSVLPTKPGHYVARAGDPPVSGPAIRLPATRAAMTGACTALQTLFSIARDEPPSAFGAAGSDAHEELKLQIAFALREESEREQRIQQALDTVRWEGRCAWLDVRVPHDVSVVSPEEGMIESEGPVPGGAAADHPETSRPSPPACIKILVDGAHNSASALALRQYIDLCISPPSSSSGDRPITVTWLMAFSKGKDISGMLHALLSSSLSSSLDESITKLSINEATNQRPQPLVRNRVGFLPFSTPVEGMPWVQSARPDECLAQLDSLDATLASSLADAKTFERLEDALQWAAQGAKDMSLEGKEEEAVHLIVLCGSLYLVGDLYRFQERRIEP
ncbi:Mur ligase [Tilletiaria anomala UBC 951]|uniref:Mur ligase n=1 Tax=Tilletiaria anomala (strain ATCC 24038 / CBS 436.72 / UBC 951) TaxID=1037660 RepID=A0A066WHU4_TILAU|nr:Mur ligase [Tilletiaria anomala UBC 951]KDN53346.1 Mur ligase [Tilletiaria anomala UBC 951]